MSLTPEDPVQEINGEVSLVWDVFGLDNEWLMTVTSPIGWEADAVSSFLNARGFNITLVLHRHTATERYRRHDRFFIPCFPPEDRYSFLFELIKRLTKWRSHMSYNDSYFGEPTGELKRIAGEMERDVDNLNAGRK